MIHFSFFIIIFDVLFSCFYIKQTAPTYCSRFFFFSAAWQSADLDFMIKNIITKSYVIYKIYNTKSQKPTPLPNALLLEKRGF